MELDMYLRVVRRWLWLILLMTLVAAGATFGLLQRQPPVYVAKALLLVGPSVDSAASDLNVLRASTEIMRTYAQIATTRDILTRVIDNLHLTIGISALTGQISVTPKPDSGILTIEVRSGDPAQAIAIANGLADVLVRLRSGSAENGSSANVEQVSVLTRNLQVDAASIQLRINELESALKAANQAQGTSVITDVENKIKELEARLNAPIDPTLAKQIQDRQGRIQQLETALKSTVNVEARRMILDELSREDQVLESQNAQVLNQRRFVLDQLGEERNRLASMQSSLSTQQSRLLSELALESSHFGDVQRSLSALYPVLQDSLSGQITIIESAVNAPVDAGAPILITLIAGLAGLIMALTLAFAFEHLDDKIRTPEQLAEATGSPVWTMTRKQTNALWTRLDKQHSMAVSNGNIPAVFQWLWVNLMPIESNRVRSLLVADLEPGGMAAEIASGLAVMLAHAGKRVVLMDAQMRSPTVGAWFASENTEGLADWLSSGAGDPNLVPVDWVPGLAVLAAGKSSRNARPELILSRAQDLVTRVKHQTDILIVVGPPLAVAVESLLLASHLGGVLAVTQNGKTPRELVRGTIDNLSLAGVRLLGSVLTDASGQETIRPQASLRRTSSDMKTTVAIPEMSMTTDPLQTAAGANGDSRQGAGGDPVRA